MNKFKKCLGFLIVFLPTISQLKAQDTINDFPCACHEPDYHAPIGVMIDHGHQKGEWMVSYRYANMRMDGNLMGMHRISNDKVYEQYLMSNDKMNAHMHMLMLMYGISDRVTVMGMTAYVQNTMYMSMMMDGTMHHAHGMSNMETISVSKTSHIGDTKLYVLYTLMNKGNHQLLLSGGVSLPTGTISLYKNNMPDDRQKYSYSMQSGSGSWGILPGITYTGNANSFSWGAQVLGDVKTGKNPAGYKFGDEFSVSTWMAHKWSSWFSSSVRVNGNANAKIKGFDEEIVRFRAIEPDADRDNSGGFYSTVNLGLNISIPEGIFKRNRFGVEYGIPFYQYVNGIQMSKQGFLYAGWQYSF